MRYLYSLPVVGLATVLAGCGHHSPTTNIAIVPLTYSIGGTIAGLAGTIVLQNNGGDNLSLTHDGSFAFSVTLQPNTAYAVTIAAQPANQTCTVANASGTAMAEVTSVSVTCSLSATATDVWTWAAGSEFVNAAGAYGTQGTAAPGNTPGARREAVSWTDPSGNFWLFGGNGVGNVGMLSDVWEYSPTGREWIWQGGSQTPGVAASSTAPGAAAASNTPGAREGSAKWTDAAGNLWLFGGDDLTSKGAIDFADLWYFSPTSGQWIFVSGSYSPDTPAVGSYGAPGVAAASNLPPARSNAASWVDSAGLFWLFGGVQLNPDGSYAAVLNDLWSYSPTTGLWTWVGGSNTPNAIGVYGKQGVAAAGNIPGARMGASVWQDASNNVWLFGGLGLNTSGLAQEYSDFWTYSPTSGEWTWAGGSNTPNAGGVYGTQRAGLAGNQPGARVAATSWKDSAGNFWLFGGYGYAEPNYVGNLNDLWEYNLGTGVWTWIGGSSSTAATGTYGTQGVPANANVPGAREQAVGWTDTSGNLWLFGGFGFDSTGVQNDLNDLWSFVQSP
jgi:N-acetylneuraminic acid mutarotase